mmetsp:Transcript_59310/g.69356  ORF Transcript_59310/g.69356 Transcript_59310/m.69356 type:complete len:111 (+) Transcript_59310:152-484(+)
MLNQDSTPVADMRNIKSDPREIFDKCDVDRSGSITFDEFKAMLPQLKIQMTEPKMLKYFHQCDMDKSGKINFDEFKVVFFTCDPEGNHVGFTPNTLLMPHDAFEMFGQDN